MNVEYFNKILFNTFATKHPNKPISQCQACFEDFYLNQNKNDSHVTFGGHFGSHVEHMKKAYQQLFHAKKDKTSFYIKYQTS